MFESARLKLTTWYLFIIMVISLMFSVIIYEVLSNEVAGIARRQRQRIENNLQQAGCIYPDTSASRIIPPIPVNPEIIEEAKKRILWMLVVTNSGIFLIAGGSGYLLAGKTLQPIKDMVAEQNRFISDASHELRTPLTALRTTFEVYLRSKKTRHSESKEIIADSLNEIERLQKLSDSLLQLSKFQSVHTNKESQVIDVASLIAEIIKKFKAIAQNKNIEIISEVGMHKINGHLESIRELFTILIDNAIKYSPDSTKVTLSSKATRNYLKVMVSDQGFGIDSSDLPHIFDRFYRSDTARTTQKSEGFGLGLSIAQKIAKQHNGLLTVKSTPRKGSTFTLTLPL